MSFEDVGRGVPRVGRPCVPNVPWNPSALLAGRLVGDVTAVEPCAAQRNAQPVGRNPGCRRLVLGSLVYTGWAGSSVTSPPQEAGRVVDRGPEPSPLVYCPSPSTGPGVPVCICPRMYPPVRPPGHFFVVAEISAFAVRVMSYLASRVFTQPRRTSGTKKKKIRLRVPGVRGRAMNPPCPNGRPDLGRLVVVPVGRRASPRFWVQPHAGRPMTTVPERPRCSARPGTCGSWNQLHRPCPSSPSCRGDYDRVSISGRFVAFWRGS